MRQEIIVMSALIALSGFIALEFGVTAAIGELIAGMLARQFIGFEDVGVIETLAEIGILILMYVAGLEIDLDQLHRRLRPSLRIGFSAFILPFCCVLALTYFLLCFELKQALLASIALSTTSIAVIYPILKQAGEMSEDRKLMLSSAMVTELLSISFLSIFFTPHPEAIILLVLGLFVLAKSVPMLGAKIFRHYRGNVAEFEFKMILLLLLAVAVVSERVGFESAVMAFLVGMATSEVVVQHENLDVKLRGVVFGFFAPIFFFWVGLGIDLWRFFDNIILLLTLLLVSYAATYAGAYHACRRVLYQCRSYAGSLFNSNLTLGVIVTVFGYDSGIFDFNTYSVIIGVIVFSSLLSMVMCRAKLQVY